MNDSLALTGFACLAVGLWWIYPPGALVICGALLLALGCLGAVSERRGRARQKIVDRIALARSRHEPLRDGIFDPEGAD